MLNAACVVSTTAMRSVGVPVVKAPSTLGNVGPRQLDRVSRELLARAWSAHFDR